MEDTFYLMGHIIKANLKMICMKAKANFNLKKLISIIIMMVSFHKINFKVKEYQSIKMVHIIKDYSRIQNIMGLELFMIRMGKFYKKAIGLRANSSDS